MSSDRFFAPDFETLVRQLADYAAGQIRERARADAPGPPAEPSFDTVTEAAAALRGAFPARGAASRALAAETGRSRRTAQTWLAACPPRRVHEFINAVRAIVFELAEHEAAEAAQRLLDEAEEEISNAGAALAAPELRQHNEADVGGVDVAYSGIKDRHGRNIGTVRFDPNPIADALPDIDAAAFLFQAAAMDDYGPGLSEVLQIIDYDDGIELR